jgi:hypothetical protein
MLIMLQESIIHVFYDSRKRWAGIDQRKVKVDMVLFFPSHWVGVASRINSFGCKILGIHSNSKL